MVGATSSVAGTAGLVPAPAAGKNTRALFSDASFGEIPLLPQYKNTVANRYYRNFNYDGFSLTGYTGSASLRIFSLIFVPANGDIDILATITSSAPSSNVNIHIGMWEASEAGEPSTLVCSGTASSGTSGTTNITTSISPSVSVNRGFYWMSITPEANTSSGALGRNNAGAMYNNIIGASGINNQATTFSYTCGSSYNQTTHETFLLTATNFPAVAFQYV